MKLILSQIRNHIVMFLIAIVFLTIESISDLIQPMLMSHIVDEGVKYQNTSLILWYGAIMLGVAAIGALGAVVRNYYASRTSQLIGKELRLTLYKKVTELSFENIDHLQPGSLITRITNDVTQIQNFINGSMRIIIKAPIICIGAIVLILVQTPKLFPMILIILLVSALLIMGNMMLGYPRFRKLQQKLDRLNTVSREFLSSIRVVKAFQREDFEEQKFTNCAEELAHAGVSAMRVTAVFSPLIQLTVNLGIIVLLGLSGSGNYVNVGKLMASVNYMTQVLFALGMVSNILNMAVRASASANRANEILLEKPTQTIASTPKKPDIKGEIEFVDVSFTYLGTSSPSLIDINFHLNPGETIGIIGSTGSGKSTLINLIPRFYDATRGQVLIDGVSVTDIDSSHLRNAIAIVPQKPLLFSGSIRSNLLWGKKDATQQEIKKASKLACADDFVMKLNDGYDTELGQGGVNLSGGQKQRLSIARALIRKPKILILDDCTSALDAKTEASVLQGIRTITNNMTVLLISQRISTVMKSDRILCLENGEINGYGTHEQLMTSCKTYQEIYQSQIGGEDNGR